jgi:hypothetical protein
MCDFSSSSRRAQAVRQCAFISGQKSEPIPFSPLLFARQSMRYLEELVLGSGPSDIVIDSTFGRDSVVQFIAACEGANFSLSLSNVFEIELLCDEWSVEGAVIHQKVTEFIQHQQSDQSLWLRRLLFRLDRGASTSEVEDLLRRNLVRLVCDSAALEIPVAIMSRIIDFRCCEGRQEEYEQLFTFCVRYLRVHGSSASGIMRTLDVTRLNDEDLGDLCALEQLNWGVLNESVDRYVIGLRKELLGERKESGELRNKIQQQQKEITVLRNEIEEQRRSVVGIEQEISRQQSANADQRRQLEALESELGIREGKIARQVSEIESLKTAKQKSDNDLKGYVEAKGEVAKLKEEIRRLTSVPKLFPPSIKNITRESARYDDKRKVELDVPDGIISHLTKECGGNVHDGNIVEVTTGSFEKTVAEPGPAKHIADLEDDTHFCSTCRGYTDDIQHTKNSWVCYDFKERRILPTQYTIRSYYDMVARYHIKSWLVETSVDGISWREIDHKEYNNELNGPFRTATFSVTGGSISRFIRLVNIGRNHYYLGRGLDLMCISAWEIFGSLLE